MPALPLCIDVTLPPANPDLRRRIELLAVQIARSGAAVEAVARRKHHSDPAYGFLFGGEGSEYYAQRLQRFQVR